MRRYRGTKIAIYSIIAITALVLAASIILPLLNRLRQQSSTTPATRHLHQIGIGLLLYSNDYGHDLPDSLATLVVREKLSPELLVDPASDETPAQGSTPQEIIANIAKGGHQTFIYLGAGLNDSTATPTTLIAYEPLSVYKDGTNALFGDGHGEWLTPDKLRKCLAPPSATQAATQP